MDNFYGEACPPKMSDGRHMTDYKPNTQLNEQIKYINGIVRDDEYRMMLQENASKIADREWSILRQTKSCWKNECVHNFGTSIYPPRFRDELRMYNDLAVPSHEPKYICKPYEDYRLTESYQYVPHKNEPLKQQNK